MGCRALQETLPYDAATLRQRIASGSPAQLQDMQEALEQRARELTSEIITLALPDIDPRGSVPLSLVRVTLNEGRRGCH